MRILHVLRAPVGGLFRHVVDLAEGQAARGHDVGLVVDGSSIQPSSEKTLAALAPQLTLGISRTAISRQPGLRDIPALLHVARHVRAVRAEVLHGHGAKGGGFARLVPVLNPLLRVYTPHGGSLHDAIGNKVHILMERALKWRSDLCLFESSYSADNYRRKVGIPRGLVRVVHNGVRSAEFEPVSLGSKAADFVFVGEMRDLKGVDLLIEALDGLRREGVMATAVLVGDGPQVASYRNMVKARGLDGQISFAGRLPAREAFARGRVVVVPSRAESFPYIVLEAAAAEKPLIASRVGGIPEIFGHQSDRLIHPGQVAPLQAALRDALGAQSAPADLTRDLRLRVQQKFSADVMVNSVLDAYRQAFEAHSAIAGQDQQDVAGTLPAAYSQDHVLTSGANRPAGCSTSS